MCEEFQRGFWQSCSLYPVQRLPPAAIPLTYARLALALLWWRSSHVATWRPLCRRYELASQGRSLRQSQDRQPLRHSQVRTRRPPRCLGLNEHAYVSDCFRTPVGAYGPDFPDAHGRRLASLSAGNGFRVVKSIIACLVQREAQSARTNTTFTFAFRYSSDLD